MTAGWRHLGIFFGLAALMLIAEAGPTAASSSLGQDVAYNAWLAKRPFISQIDIEGNTVFSDGTIKSHLFSRRNSFWESFRSGSQNRVLRYSIYRDTLEIKFIYLRAGFLNVRVSERFEPRLPDSTARLIIGITEGERFLVRSVALQATDTLSFFSRLAQETSRLKPGAPVDPIIINQIIFDLKTIYANNGYPYAVVREFIDSTAGPAQTKIVFRVEEGVMVRFGRLEVRNLHTYAPYLVRREIAFKEGEVYSRDKIIESQKRLYATGLFNAVNLGIAAAPAGDAPAMDTTPNFSFSAIERKPHFVTVKTGAGQDSLQDLIWDFSAAWGKRNIFVSRRIEFSINSRYIIFTQWRPLSHRFQVRFTEPRFLDFRMPLSLTAQFEPGVSSQTQPYRVQTWSLALSTRKEWSEQLYGVVTGEYENVNIYGVSPDAALLIRQEQDISIRRKLSATLIRDTRLDKFVPQSGSYTTYFLQYVGGLLGGDDSFLKGEFSWARYQPAIGNAIYATRFKAGWVKEFGESHSVPSTDRFFLGGANSIRGFKENTIGPRTAGTAAAADSTNLGANAYIIFNQELRAPLFWKFWGTIFADLGNGYESFSQVGMKDILFSYGAGVAFLSPAGPVRLDYAQRVRSGIYDAGHRLHFTILFAF